MKNKKTRTFIAVLLSTSLACGGAATSRGTADDEREDDDQSDFVSADPVLVQVNYVATYNDYLKRPTFDLRDDRPDLDTSALAPGDEEELTRWSVGLTFSAVDQEQFLVQSIGWVDAIGREHCENRPTPPWVTPGQLPAAEEFVLLDHHSFEGTPASTQPRSFHLHHSRGCGDDLTYRRLDRSEAISDLETWSRQTMSSLLRDDTETDENEPRKPREWVFARDRGNAGNGLLPLITTALELNREGLDIFSVPFPEVSIFPANQSLALVGGSKFEVYDRSAQQAEVQAFFEVPTFSSKHDTSCSNLATYYGTTAASTDRARIHINERSFWFSSYNTEVVENIMLHEMAHWVDHYTGMEGHGGGEGVGAIAWLRGFDDDEITLSEINNLDDRATVIVGDTMYCNVELGWGWVAGLGVGAGLILLTVVVVTNPELVPAVFATVANSEDAVVTAAVASEVADDLAPAVARAEGRAAARMALTNAAERLEEAGRNAVPTAEVLETFDSSVDAIPDGIRAPANAQLLQQMEQLQIAEGIQNEAATLTDDALGRAQTNLLLRFDGTEASFNATIQALEENPFAVLDQGAVDPIGGGPLETTMENYFEQRVATLQLREATNSIPFEVRQDLMQLMTNTETTVDAYRSIRANNGIQSLALDSEQTRIFLDTLSESITYQFGL